MSNNELSLEIEILADEAEKIKSMGQAICDAIILSGNAPDTYYGAIELFTNILSQHQQRIYFLIN